MDIEKRVYRLATADRAWSETELQFVVRLIETGPDPMCELDSVQRGVLRARAVMAMGRLLTQLRSHADEGAKPLPRSIAEFVIADAVHDHDPRVRLAAAVVALDSGVLVDSDVSDRLVEAVSIATNDPDQRIASWVEGRLGRASPLTRENWWRLP